MIFEVLVIKHPTKVEEKKGTLESILFGPQFVVAKTDKTAAIRVMRNTKFPKLSDVELDRCEVIVRPFAKRQS